MAQHTTQIGQPDIVFETVESEVWPSVAWVAPCGCEFKADLINSRYLSVIRPCFDEGAAHSMDKEPESETGLISATQAWLASWNETAIAELLNEKKAAEEAKAMFSEMLKSVYPQYVAICEKVRVKPMSEADWQEMQMTDGCDCCSLHYLPDTLL